jgi:hypothetical protein
MRRDPTTIQRFAGFRAVKMIGYSMPLARESSIEPYEIAAPVGAGGMGEVY